MKRLIVGFIALVLLVNMGNAQSRNQDSLTLKLFYKDLGGSNWTNNTDWNAGPMHKWFGIKLKNDLVWDILLKNNKLQGAVSTSHIINHALGKVDLGNNKLTALPSTIVADSLFVNNNLLTITHLLPYAGMGDKFRYGGQDSIDINRTEFGLHRDEIILNTNIDRGVPGVQYKWYKNNELIEGADSVELKLTCLTRADTGNYVCELTHPSLPKLRLFTRAIALQISSDDPDPGPEDRTCQETYTLRGSRPVLGTGKWSSVNGKGSVVNTNNPNAVVTGLLNGPNIFRWSVNYAACQTEFKDVIIYKDTLGEFPFAGRDTVICDTAYTMNASPLLYGKGSWKLVQGGMEVSQNTNPSTAAYNIEPGINIMRWVADNGACQSFFDEVKIIRELPLTNTQAGRDTALCGTELFLDAGETTNVWGTWTLISGAGKTVDNTYEKTYIYNLGEGDNVWVWTANNVCAIPVEDTVHIWVHYFVRANAGPDTMMFFTPSDPLIIASDNLASGGTGGFTYVWSPDDFLLKADQPQGDFMPPSPGIYPFKILVTDSKGCMDSSTRTIEVVQVVEIDIPTLFTPNDDGINDVFILPGIESYPDSEWVIMDQTGQVVYRQSGYRNDWTGIANEGYYAGEMLVEGTYFYFLDLGHGADRVQKGFFVVKR